MQSIGAIKQKKTGVSYLDYIMPIVGEIKINKTKNRYHGYHWVSWAALGRARY